MRCRASGSFGIQGTAGACRARPGAGGSGERIQSALGFVRCEDGAGRAAGCCIKSPKRARASAPNEPKAWRCRTPRSGRRLIVSGSLTISSASVQRVHATLGFRSAPSVADGGMSCRGRLLGWGPVRVRSARGWRAGGDAGSCRASGSSAVSRTSARACALCAGRALPSAVFGLREFAPFLRLASARALLIQTAARGDCPAGLGTGLQPRSDRAILHWTWGDSLLAVGSWRVWWRRARRHGPGSGSLADYRNIV